jgi:hypothetical protein
MEEIIDLEERRSPRPRTENGKVAPPLRRRNRDLRTHEHLTPDEVERLIEAAARIGRHPLEIGRCCS